MMLLNCTMTHQETVGVHLVDDVHVLGCVQPRSRCAASAVDRTAQDTGCLHGGRKTSELAQDECSERRPVSAQEQELQARLRAEEEKVRVSYELDKSYSNGQYHH